MTSYSVFCLPTHPRKNSQTPSLRPSSTGLVKLSDSSGRACASYRKIPIFCQELKVLEEKDAVDKEKAIAVAAKAAKKLKKKGGKGGKGKKK